MLSFRREELTGFLEDIGAPWVEDPMNEDERFTRVKIRKRLRPFMEEEFGHGTWKAVARAASFLAGAEDALETEARRKFDECTIRRFPHWVSLDGSALQGYLEEWRYRVIRYAFAHADGVPASDLHLKLHEVQRIEQFIMQGAKGARLALRDKIELRWREDCIIFNGLSRVEPQTWQVLDILELPDGGFLIAEERPRSEFKGKSLRPGRVEWVDADKFGTALKVRPLRDGDRLAAIGDTKPRKIPKLLRGNHCHHGQAWIVCDSHEIKFIAGHRIAKSVAVTPATTRVLRLTWVPPEPIVP
jgi:tRNA(Ile)-lysidine synthase